jgi:hypothetical protein
MSVELSVFCLSGLCYCCYYCGGSHVYSACTWWNYEFVYLELLLIIFLLLQILSCCFSSHNSNTHNLSTTIPLPQTRRHRQHILLKQYPSFQASVSLFLASLRTLPPSVACIVKNSLVGPNQPPPSISTPLQQTRRHRHHTLLMLYPTFHSSLYISHFFETSYRLPWLLSSRTAS